MYTSELFWGSFNIIFNYLSFIFIFEESIMQSIKINTYIIRFSRIGTKSNQPKVPFEYRYENTNVGKKYLKENKENISGKIVK